MLYGEKDCIYQNKTKSCYKTEEIDFIPTITNTLLYAVNFKLYTKHITVFKWMPDIVFDNI